MGILFTFHYGPIQIAIHYLLFFRVAHLHSTMVLFKFEKGIVDTFLFIFTFHYGPIQINQDYSASKFNYNLHSTMVLFKLNPGHHYSFFRLYLHSTMVLFKYII